MKKITVLFLLFSSFFYGQLSYYSFTQSLETFNSITSPTTVLNGGIDSGASGLTDIGFDFVFDGITYTQFSATSNGYIRLGSVGGTTMYTPISSTNAGPAIAFFARDGKTNGAVVYELTGTAPNRVLTVEYPNYYVNWSSTTNTLSAQIKLYEGSNEIQIVYGTSAKSTSYTGQVGLVGTTTSNYSNRTTTTNWSSTASGTSNTSTMTWSSTVGPINGLIYSWIPATCFPPTALSSSVITASGADLSWTASASIPSNNYDVYWSTTNTAPDGTTTPSATNVTSTYTASGLTSNTTYYWWVRANCGGGDLGAWISGGSFTTQFVVSAPYFEGFATTSTPLGWGITGWLIGSNRGATGNPGNNIYKNFYGSSTTGSFTVVNVQNIANGTLLSFDYKFSNYNSPYSPPASGSGSFNIELSNDYGITYSSIGTLNLDGVAGWRAFSYDLSSYVGQVVKLRISGVRTLGDWDAAFDNIKIEIPPSCSSPTALSSSVITTSGADLSWTASISSPSNNYDVYWNTTNIAPDGTTTPSATNVTSTYTASGLTSNTTYYWWVRSNCGGGDVSTWTVGGSFTTLPSCIQPTALSSSAVTASSADLSWTASTSSPSNNYDVYWSTTNTAPDGTTTPSDTNVTSTYTASGLISNTTYYWWVRANCGGGDVSTWANGGSFSTQFAVSAPYFEGFTTTSTPLGWSITGWLVGSNRGATGNPGNNIYKNFYGSSTTGSFTIVNVEDITNGMLLSFDYKFSNYSSPYSPPASGSGSFNIELSNDYGITYSSIGTLNLDGVAGWRAFSYDLSSYAGQVVKLRISGVRTLGDWDVAFDNIKIDIPPSCLPPTTLSSSMITASGADLSWTASTSSPSNNYDVYWSTTSTAPDGTTTPSETSVTSTYTASGLTSNTTYYWWVRANCGGGDVSTWVSGGSFKTPLSCGDTFYDTGGASASYSDNENVTTVIYPSLGNAVTVTFNSFNTESGYDFLKVYDGPNNTYPALHTGNGYSGTTIPGPFTSSDPSGTLTFVFTSDGSTTRSGWNALVSCNPLPCTITHTWNGSSWTPSAPTANQIAVINGNYTGSGFDACTLDVLGTSVVNINSGILNIEGAINVATSASLTLENDINLVQLQNVSNTGNITVKRNSTPMIRLDYTAWSSPVLGQNLFNFSPNTVSTRFYTYNEAGTTSTTAWTPVPSPATTNFDAGIGYLIRVDNTWSSTTPAIYPGEFTGVPNNGDYSVAVSFTGPGFNLIGNPYPSTIDAYTFAIDNNVVNNPSVGLDAMYFWTHAVPSSSGIYPANNYASYTAGGGGVAAAAGGPQPNGEIQIGQGFIAHVNGSGNLLFNNSQRLTSNNSQFYRASSTPVERHRIWLNFGNDSNNYNQILIGYIENATFGVDSGIDGSLFSTSSTNLYSLIDNNEYVIQGRPLPFDENDEVPLGFTIENAGIFSVSIDHFDDLFENQNIYIWDKFENIIHDLKLSDYIFNSESGVFNSRFSIVYSANILSLEEIASNFNAVIYVQNNDLIISTGNETMTNVIVYDIQGRKLVSKNNVNSSDLTLHSVSATSQILLVEIYTRNGKVTKKIKM